MTTQELVARLKKRPFSTACTVLSLVLAGVYFFRQGSGPEATALLSERMNESSRLKANISNSASLKDQVAALEEANGKVAGRLVRASDVARNQQYFYKIEAESGVKLLDLRPGNSGPAKTNANPGVKKLYSAVPYNCTVQGTYSQLLTFLKKLENGEHFERILSATMSLSGGSSTEGDAADPILSLSLAIELLGQS